VEDYHIHISKKQNSVNDFETTDLVKYTQHQIMV